jgi:ParB family chromosome partitioning protein
MIENIKLDHIEPNPWQPRQGNDPAGIEELAFSIARDGLLQVPVGRPAPPAPPQPSPNGSTPFGEGEYQLAIGHRRLLAFRLLASIEIGFEDGIPPALVEMVRTTMKAGGSFHEMPLDVQGLTDLQMFEMAISENIQRKDLNPVEQAAAMKCYMDEFHVTSQKAGEFFGVNDATVRGTVRLLDLPPVAQEKLAAGEMTIGTARKLLTVQRAAGEAAAKEMTSQLSKPNADIEEVVNSQLKRNMKGVEMWGSWRDQDAPQAGIGLWPLAMSKKDFPNDLLPVISEAEEAKALGQEFTAELRANLRKWNKVLCLRKPELVQKLIADGAPENDIERLVHLIAPPACPACPFYARIDKQHYCAFAACHKRKVKAWSQAELRQLSKELSIPVYDPKEHGKETFALKSQWNDKGKIKELFDARSDVCLQAKHNDPQTMYGNKHDFTDSYTVQAIAVGKKAHKLIEKRKKDNDRSAQESKYAEGRRQQNIELENRMQSNNFIENVAAPVFAPAFAGVEKVEPLLALLQRDPDKKFKAASKGQQLELLRQEMADRALDHIVNFPIKKNGPLATAKHLQGVAKTWGVKLPDNWLYLARPYLKGLEEYQGLDGKTVVVTAKMGGG